MLQWCFSKNYAVEFCIENQTVSASDFAQGQSMEIGVSVTNQNKLV